MNRLQRLQTQAALLRQPEPATDLVPAVATDPAPPCFTHPVYTFDSLATQARLAATSTARDRTYFCGSYFGYGFHEDAVRSAVEVAERLGVHL